MVCGPTTLTHARIRPLSLLLKDRTEAKKPQQSRPIELAAAWPHHQRAASVMKLPSQLLLQFAFSPYHLLSPACEASQPATMCIV